MGLSPSLADSCQSSEQQARRGAYSPNLRASFGRASEGRPHLPAAEIPRAQVTQSEKRCSGPVPQCEPFGPLGSATSWRWAG